MENDIYMEVPKKRKRLRKPIRDAINYFQMGMWFALGVYLMARVLLEFFCLI